MKLWKQSYEKSGDLIGFTREWKSILASEYHLYLPTAEQFKNEINKLKQMIKEGKNN